MICDRCKEFKPIENKDTMLCATCNKLVRDTNDLYPVVRTMFLQKMIDIEAVCPIMGTPITMESDIHHIKGRKGFASAEKRLNCISLLIDVDHFLAVSREGHNWIEAAENRAEAERRGFIKSRLSNEE
jgi:hypothetical protein